MEIAISPPLLSNHPPDVRHWQVGQRSGIVYLYTLLCPVRLTARYIGITIDPWERFRYHLKARSGTHKDRWIRGLMARGLKPFIVIAEAFTSREEAKLAECATIASMKGGFSLTNLTPGGDYPSLRPMSDQRRALYRQRMLVSNPSFGGLSRQHKDRISETCKKTLSAPAIRLKRSRDARRAKRGRDGRFIS